MRIVQPRPLTLSLVLCLHVVHVSLLTLALCNVIVWLCSGAACGQ